MDFFIPQEHFSILQMYYQADEAQDDMYEVQEYSNLPQNPEFECLLDQKQKASLQNRKFKGSTYYYKVG